MVNVWIGGVEQRTFGLCAAAPPLTNQTVSSSWKLSECMDGIFPKAMYKVKQHSKPWCTVQVE